MILNRQFMSKTVLKASLFAVLICLLLVLAVCVAAADGDGSGGNFLRDVSCD